MRTSDIVGMLGAIQLTIGLFVPILKLPYNAVVTYYGNDLTGGVLLLLIAIGTAISINEAKFKTLYFLGTASLGINSYTFYTLYKIRQNIQEYLLITYDKEFAMDITKATQFSYGWLFLIVGSCCIIASAYLRQKRL